jgi:hypothetical protein
MLPLDLDGFVDCKLKVYGTTNVQVVGTSVILYKLTGHTTGRMRLICGDAGTPSQGRQIR